MIEALYDIGKIQPRKDFLDEYIEDIGTGYKHVFKIVFNIDDPSNIRYKEIAYEEFDKANKLKYFYKRGSSRGTDKSPTSKVTSLDKTFNEKILKSVNDFKSENAPVLSTEDKSFLESLHKSLNFHKDRIKADLVSRIKGSMEILGDKDEIKEGGILTLAFEKGSHVIPLGEMDVFRETIRQQEKAAFRSYYYSTTRKHECRGFDSHCFICGEKKTEVWGLVGTFKSYTVDKPGMVTGGFDQASAWKNYPVCPDCMIILERGKNYLEENLGFRFCGFNYFIIPQLSVDDPKLLGDILNKLKNMKDFSLAEKEAEITQRAEERIIEKLAEQGNYLNFNFLFFKEEQSGSVFNILLYLQEIAPHMLSRLIKAKADVDNEINKSYPVFPDITYKTGKTFNFDFRFALLRDFFPDSRIEGNFDKDFLALIDHIFIGRKIGFELLLKRFMSRIRVEFSNDDRPYLNTVRLAYKIVLYIDRLKLLKRRILKMADTQQAGYLADFFNEHAIFDNDTKKAVFLEGVLAEKLLAVQYRERNSKPFRSRLNGLKIDEKTARRLLPEMINKLEEYDKNYYKELEQGVAAYMLDARFSAFSVDELSFYFTLGMSLANTVLPKNKKEEENTDESNSEQEK